MCPLSDLLTLVYGFTRVTQRLSIPTPALSDCQITVVVQFRKELLTVLRPFASLRVTAEEFGMINHLECHSEPGLCEKFIGVLRQKPVLI
jgi:hypothetical protein